MHKPRHKARVARVLSYGKSHGKDSRKLTLCTISFCFLLLASLSILQVAISGKRADSLDSSHDGRVWKGRLWLGGGGDGEKKVQRMERTMENNGGDHTKSSEDQEEAAEEDEGDRFEDLENEMDMEDDEGDDFEGFGGSGDAGEWQNHSSEKRLLEETERKGLGVRQQLVVGGAGARKSGGEEADGRTKGAGMVEAHELGAGAVNSSDSVKGVSAGLPLLLKVAQGRGLQGDLGMFSSDDEPIDEETRLHVEHMSSIEDVLMLSNKERLATIQDDQPLNKEKWRRASSNPLNPENNPLLQDPDSVGQDGGGLTKYDRAFKWSSHAGHSSLIEQNTPDGRVKDDSKEGTGSQLMHVAAGGHNEQARKAPAQNASRRRKVVEELELLKHKPEPSGSRHSKGESFLETVSGVSKTKEPQRTRHKKKEGKKAQKLNYKVDMRGWGYFPGHHPEVTFSSFMQDFLFDEKCSLRVFMAWMTPPWSFTVRHQRVLESLLYFHPTACVVVFSDTIELDFFKSFTDEGYRIATVMPDLEELLDNTPADVFATIFNDWRTVDLFYLHYTDLLRLGALYKYGGIYLDFDMIVLKALTSLNNTIGLEVLENGHSRPNGAIMVFEKFSSFLNRSMEEFTATYDENLRAWNGADLLDRVMKAQPEGNDFKLPIWDKPQVNPPVSFFPLSSESIFRYFIAPEENEAIAEESELFNQILSKSFTVHLWNGLTFSRIPEPGSLIDKLMGRNCLHCTEIL